MVTVCEQISTGRKYALKTINTQHIKTSLEELEQEVNIMKTMDHPNIVRLYEVFKDRHSLHMIMELCEGGELFDRLYEQKGAHFTEARAAELITKMLSSLL